MDIIEISIHDEGEHWHKKVSVLGICVYHRHDYTKNAEKRSVGFNTMAPVSGEVEDDEYWEEDKHKQLCRGGKSYAVAEAILNHALQDCEKLVEATKRDAEDIG